MLVEMLREVAEEMPWGLLQSVQGMFQLKEALTPMHSETTGLMDVDLFFRRQFSMNESSSNVSLCRFEAKDNRKNHHHPDS